MPSLTITKNAVNMKLNNGTSATGAVKTLTVSLGKIASTWTDTEANYSKALNLSNAIGACLAKSVYSLERVSTGSIRN